MTPTTAAAERPRRQPARAIVTSFPMPRHDDAAPMRRLAPTFLASFHSSRSAYSPITLLGASIRHAVPLPRLPIERASLRFSIRIPRQSYHSPYRDATLDGHVAPRALSGFVAAISAGRFSLPAPPGRGTFLSPAGRVEARAT